LTQPAGVVANITQKALTITASNVNSVYGSTTGLGSNGFSQTGLLSGDAISAVTLLYSGSAAIPATVNAGTYNGVINASAATGTGLANYAISYVAGNLIVGKATLTATPVAQSAVYNGSTLNATTYSANGANYAITGYKNSDSISNVSLSFTGLLHRF
jgi:mucin-19